MSGDDVASDFGRLCGEYNGQSLMGGRRVIMVRDAGNQLSKDLRKMLDDSKSDNLLILYACDLNKKSSLVKLAENSDDMACVACYEDKNEDIYNTLKTMGLVFDQGALQLLYSRMSGDRMINLAELEKLKIYMGDAKNVTAEIVAKVISDQSDSSIDDICYAVMGGNRGEAEILYQKYVSEGNEPVTVLRLLVYHVLKLLNCQAGIEKKETIDAVVKKLAPPIIFYRQDAFKAQLLRVLGLLYDAEKDCKTTGMPAAEIVSLTLLKLAGAAKR